MRRLLIVMVSEAKHLVIYGRNKPLRGVYTEQSKCAQGDKLKITLFFSFCLLALSLFAHPVQAQTPTGTIAGQIANGTKDAKPTSIQNLQIRLFGIDASATHPISATAQSDPNGRFIFQNLDTTPTTKYLVAANYGGVDYFSDALAFDASQPQLTAEIKVYETTTDASVLQIMQTHFIFDVQTRAFNVVQIIVAQNTGDRTLIAGANRATLLLPILAGAQNVHFSRQDADQMTLRGDGMMTYTLPIAPGAEQIVYTYGLTYTPPTYQFSLKLPFDSPRVRILLADVGGTIASQQFAPPTPFQAQGGQKYLLSVVENVRAGSVLNATFTNLPASIADPTRPANQSEPLVAGLVLGISALLAGTLLIYPIVRRREQSA